MLVNNRLFLETEGISKILLHIINWHMSTLSTFIVANHSHTRCGMHKGHTSFSETDRPRQELKDREKSARGFCVVNL